MKLTPEGLADMVVGTIKRAVDGPQVAGRIARLEGELAEARQEVAALKSTAYLKDAGIWRHGTTYALGDVSSSAEARGSAPRRTRLADRPSITPVGACGSSAARTRDDPH